VARARLVFIGSGPFGLPALHRLSAAGEAAPFRIVGVVTAPPRPAGRHGRVQATPIESAARAAGLAPVLTPGRLRDPATLAEILALDPAVLVLADYGRIVPPPLLALPSGALNLHPSLLPRHRGAAPIPATIMAGDAQTGVTIIRMDDGIDTGPIVAVESVHLSGTETAPELEARLADTAASLLERTIGPWLRDEIQPRPQPTDGATQTTILRREDGRLDPGVEAASLERRVRALQPWPGTFVETAAGRISVHRAHVEPRQAGDGLGLIVAADGGFAIVAVDGRLVVDEAQAPGSRRMAGVELLRGRPSVVGTLVLDPRPG
jgi:methionyl-tRNA formyltransferase